MTFIPLKIDLTEPKKVQCKGLVYRGYRSVYHQDGKIEIRQGIRKLKKQSCPGCDSCFYLEDTLQEDISCGNFIMPDIVYGALYSIKTTNIGRDWDSGVVDSWDTEVYQIPQNN